MIELRVRQPYANLIVNGQKGIEYRSWKLGRLGPCIIHATGGEGQPQNCYLGAVIFSSVRKTSSGYEWVIEHPIRFPVAIKSNVHSPIQVRSASDELIRSILAANKGKNLGWFGKDSNLESVSDID